MAGVDTMGQCPSQSMMKGDMAGTEEVLSEVEWVVTPGVVTRRRMCLLGEPDMVGTEAPQRQPSTTLLSAQTKIINNDEPKVPSNISKVYAGMIYGCRRYELMDWHCGTDR
jgi:hypothetical protein